MKKEPLYAATWKKENCLEIYEFQKELYQTCVHYGIFPRGRILKQASKKIRESIFAASLELWKHK